MAIQRYVNQKKVPYLFISTGADKRGDYKHFAWTMGYQPSYRTEVQIYTKYMTRRSVTRRWRFSTRMTTAALKASGANVLFGRHQAQVRGSGDPQLHDMDWHPDLLFMTNVSISVGSSRPGPGTWDRKTWVRFSGVIEGAATPDQSRSWLNVNAHRGHVTA